MTPRRALPLPEQLARIDQQVWANRLKVRRLEECDVRRQLERAIDGALESRFALSPVDHPSQAELDRETLKPLEEQ